MFMNVEMLTFSVSEHFAPHHKKWGFGAVKLILSKTPCLVIPHSQGANKRKAQIRNLHLKH